MSRRSATTTKVFVGSLPQGVTPEDLRRLFEPYGAIAECDISNRCGFLHLEDHDLAMKAISELNGIEFMGGKISVEKGRVKPRRGGGGPMRGGGRDRGGPYTRGRGPPQRNGFGGGRDYYGGGPGGRFDRPPARGGYDGGYGDRRPGAFDDRRGGPGGYPPERRPYNSYGDRGYDDRGYDDRRPPPSGYDDRRPPMNDRRGGPPLDGPGPRGAGYDRGAGGGDLFSRRGEGPKPMSSNGYGGGYGSGGAPGGGYQGGAGGYGDGGRGYGGGPGGYSGSGGGYGGGQGGGYGDSYGGGSGPRGSYDTAYPPLPQQRGGFSSGGAGPGPRRDMAPGRRY